MSETVSNRLTILAAEILNAYVRLLSSDEELDRAEAEIEVGHKLLEAKVLVGRGKWQSWGKEHCLFSVRTARQYMRRAKEAEQIWEGFQQWAKAHELLLTKPPSGSA